MINQKHYNFNLRKKNLAPVNEIKNYIIIKICCQKVPAKFTVSYQVGVFFNLKKMEYQDIIYQK